MPKKKKETTKNLTPFIPNLLVESGDVTGHQRPLASYNAFADTTLIGRNYDLEITEFPVRDSKKARQLIEMWEYCPEIATAISEISDSVWSSDDGDDQGFTISTTLNDNVTSIDKNVYSILLEFINNFLHDTKPAIERLLMYGDAFANIGLDVKNKTINKVLFLPTWEIFRIEDNQGNLGMLGENGQIIGFQQRKYLTVNSNNLWQDDNGRTEISYHPLSIVHWRKDRKTLYGRSLFYQSTGDWDALKASIADLQNACRAIGINPNLHIMPECADEKYRADYKAAYEYKKSLGSVFDFYLMNGADIKKLSSGNPDLTALANTVLFWRARIVMQSRVPPYLMGLPAQGARDLAGQPALAYARFINSVRMCFAQGIRQLCNLQLLLKGIPKEQWNYRIIFPKIATNPYGNNQLSNDESNLLGVEDLDSFHTKAYLQNQLYQPLGT
jgi:hypothetical protein